MKTFSLLLTSAVLLACSQQPTSESSATQAPAPGQSAVADPDSEPNVLQLAIQSADHSTLVAAVKAAELTDVLSNAGPFTVFAPVNKAFEALPPGTVDDLLKPENKAQLVNVLEYHVYVGVIRENMIRNGMVLNQVNGKNVTLGKSGDQITVNGANVLATVKASNGLIYVVDQVLLAP